VTISPDQIQKLAILAKLKIDESSMHEISSQLDNIMALIDQMEQADTTGIEPLSHPQDPELRLREDKVTQIDMRDEFMKLTPHNQDGLYLVPKVIE
jgi:aspartyl-tRNA(Asn)/glutamyl-tRNA(Gln) amidotransferase subunit C